MELTKGQQAAADAFFQMLLDDSQKEIIVSGPAGVGKTFWMGYLIDTVMPQYHNTCKLLGMVAKYHEVEMTATTNKAAEVLGLATGRPTRTIHSALGLKVTENYSDGSTKLTKSKSWRVHYNKIVFIDEAFMIDRYLYKYIQEGFHNCKIVFVGDHCQLTSVTETICPILQQNLPTFHLTEQMRTKDQYLMALHAQLRQTVESKEFHPIHLSAGSVEYLDAVQMEQLILNHMLDPNHNNKILTYTNNQAIAFNDYIRHARGITQPYVAGEHLIANTAGNIDDLHVSVEDEIFIQSVGRDSQDEIAPNVFLDVVEAEVITPHSHGHTYLPTNKEHFYALIKYYAGQKDWPRYFYLKNNYLDLRPKDAATVHKAQGSTYDNVFIDLADLSSCRNPDTVARLLYVAITRAKHRVFLYGELSQKFGGIYHEGSIG